MTKNRNFKKNLSQSLTRTSFVFIYFENELAFRRKFPAKFVPERQSWVPRESSVFLWIKTLFSINKISLRFENICKNLVIYIIQTNTDLLCLAFNA